LTCSDITERFLDYLETQMVELSAVSDKPVRALKPGEVVLSGRIGSKARKVEGGFHTLLVLPAPDAFANPQRVEVRSAARLGDVDDDVTITCRVGGYNKRAFDYTDKATGESRKVVPNVVTLDVLP
jgi:hypothetical protein